ncbi:hypothetical protein CO046_02390 [Candidatus Peregrinibacteria bacterium CG_4_9_14_0_2_um_filter_53_11]|nr:MAG: hypothetical protein CO046_02390 [Candidatus Peregrinibacteria bacterium CG_4_9_14_0_2_um_filter_53_11]
MRHTRELPLDQAPFAEVINRYATADVRPATTPRPFREDEARFAQIGAGVAAQWSWLAATPKGSPRSVADMIAFQVRHGKGGPGEILQIYRPERTEADPAILSALYAALASAVLEHSNRKGITPRRLRFSTKGDEARRRNECAPLSENFGVWPDSMAAFGREGTAMESIFQPTNDQDVGDTHLITMVPGSYHFLGTPARRAGTMNRQLGLSHRVSGLCLDVPTQIKRTAAGFCVSMNHGPFEPTQNAFDKAGRAHVVPNVSLDLLLEQFAPALSPAERRRLILQNDGKTLDCSVLDKVARLKFHQGATNPGRDVVSELDLSVYGAGRVDVGGSRISNLTDVSYSYTTASEEEEPDRERVTANAECRIQDANGRPHSEPRTKAILMGLIDQALRTLEPREPQST